MTKQISKKNTEDIINLALDCNLGSTYILNRNKENLLKFVEIIYEEAAAAENEACAKTCEETTAAWTQHLYNEGAMDCAAAIRARRENRNEL